MQISNIKMKIKNTKLPCKKDGRWRAGFTLIEFLIYSVIVAFIMGVLVLSGVNVMQARTRVAVAEEVNHNGRVAMNRILTNIRHAKSIDSISSDILSLEVPLSVNSPTIFEVIDGILTIKRGTEEPLPITTETVTVSNLEFVNLSYPETETIRIAMTLEYSAPLQREEYEFERTFYVTENIRK